MTPERQPASRYQGTKDIPRSTSNASARPTGGYHALIPDQIWKWTAERSSATYAATKTSLTASRRSPLAPRHLLIAPRDVSAKGTTLQLSAEMFRTPPAACRFQFLAARMFPPLR